MRIRFWGRKFATLAMVSALSWASKAMMRTVASPSVSPDEAQRNSSNATPN